MCWAALAWGGLGVGCNLLIGLDEGRGLDPGGGLCADVRCAPPAEACRAAGVCDPDTGACVYPPLPDATSCDDGDACSQADQCQAGVCVGGHDPSWASWDPSLTTVYRVGGETADDSVTGLTWQRGTAPQVLSWQDAQAYCAGLRIEGADGAFRLPSRIELSSIVDFGQDAPKVERTAFPETPPEDFWTATPVPYARERAYRIQFATGAVLDAAQEELLNVRCVALSVVAPPHAAASSCHYEIGEGAVTDKDTGLVWERAFMEEPGSWEEASAYCSALETDGGGWRMPTARELSTLVDDGKFAPAIEEAVFPDTPADRFWAFVGEDEPWIVEFYGGTSFSGAQVTLPCHVRCVRSSR